MFPSTAWAKEVSKQFIMWNSGHAFRNKNMYGSWLFPFKTTLPYDNSWYESTLRSEGNTGEENFELKKKQLILGQGKEKLVWNLEFEITEFEITAVND